MELRRNNKALRAKSLNRFKDDRNGNNKRRQTTKNISLHGTKNSNTNLGRIQAVHQKLINTIRDNVLYDDKRIVPQSLRSTVNALLHIGHPSINKMSHAAEPFWWPRMNREIQQKCDECILCKMTCKNIKPQLSMREVNHLPPIEKPNQEIQLDFIGPIKFKQRRFSY